MLVLSNLVGPLLGVCQDNYTETGDTDAEDHLRYGAWLHWESPLQGPLAQQVDVDARPEERRPRKQATALAVLRRGILCDGSWRGGFRRWDRGGRPGILYVLGQ